MSLKLPQEAIPERKVPVIVLDTHTVFLERTSGMTFVHCDVHVPYSKTVRRSIEESWTAFRSLHHAPIWALHTPGDRKHATFLRLFGFRFERSFTDPEGLHHDLFIHSGA